MRKLSFLQKSVLDCLGEESSKLECLPSFFCPRLCWEVTIFHLAEWLRLLGHWILRNWNKAKWGPWVWKAGPPHWVFQGSLLPSLGPLYPLVPIEVLLRRRRGLLSGVILGESSNYSSEMTWCQIIELFRVEVSYKVESILCHMWFLLRYFH